MSTHRSHLVMVAPCSVHRCREDKPSQPSSASDFPTVLKLEPFFLPLKETELNVDVIVVTEEIQRVLLGPLTDVHPSSVV